MRISVESPVSEGYIPSSGAIVREMLFGGALGRKQKRQGVESSGSGTESVFATALNFDDVGLLGGLARASSAELDALPFGLIGMNVEGFVVSYNRTESRLAGLESETVIGRHFFSQVAPCTNNYLVAGRFEAEDAIDDTIHYVFTLRMQPTKVRLRLLKGNGCAMMFLLVERR